MTRSGLLLSTATLLVLLAACAASPPVPTAAPPPAASSATASAPSASAAPAPSKAGPKGALCGGIAGFGCAPGLYCAFPVEAQCGAADQSGVCQAIPDVCTEEYAPVCACNDKTYPNPCYAARDGVSFATRGECSPPSAPAALAEGERCGTRGISRECGPGLYCKYSSHCGETDTGGSCAPRRELCTKIYRPVCGCDGKTYGNDCEAASAGVSVRQEGACKR